MKLKQRTATRKQQILNWATKHGRLPLRSATGKREKQLATLLGNYIAKASNGFDAAFRAKLTEQFPVRFNPKGKHNPKKRLATLMTFIKTHKRTPSIVLDRGNPAVSALSGFTSPTSRYYNPTVVAKIKRLDPCLGTPIPKRLRASINSALKTAGKRLKDETK